MISAAPRPKRFGSIYSAHSRLSFGGSERGHIARNSRSIGTLVAGCLDLDLLQFRESGLVSASFLGMDGADEAERGMPSARIIGAIAVSGQGLVASMRV